MQRFTVQLATGLMLCGLAACTTQNYSVVNTPDGRVKTTESTSLTDTAAPSSIAIVRGRPDRPFEKLANLSVTVSKSSAFDNGPTRASVDRQLRAEAAKLKADAVIDVAYGPPRKSVLTWTKLEATGTAVRYRD